MSGHTVRSVAWDLMALSGGCTSDDAVESVRNGLADLGYVNLGLDDPVRPGDAERVVLYVRAHPDDEDDGEGT